MKRRIFYWTPRILCILAILFVMMFSFDVFQPNLTIGEQFMAFLMHNIPAFILIAFLVISWKWELLGGILFSAVAVFGFFFLTDFFTRNLGSMIVSAPFLLVGVLFLVYHFLYKDHERRADKNAHFRDPEKEFSIDGSE